MARGSLLQVYHQHERELVGFLARRLKCVATAGDVAHDLYVKLLAGEPTPPVRNAKGYLFRMAANLATDHQRIEARRAEILADVTDMLNSGPDGRTPERHALAQAELARLRQVVAELPPRSRAIFYLNRFAGRSQRQIARELGVSQTTVENHLRRVLAALAAAREDVDEGGDGPAGAMG